MQSHISVSFYLLFVGSITPDGSYVKWLTSFPGIGSVWSHLALKSWLSYGGGWSRGIVSLLVYFTLLLWHRGGIIWVGLVHCKIFIGILVYYLGLHWIKPSHQGVYKGLCAKYILSQNGSTRKFMHAIDPFHVPPWICHRIISLVWQSRFYQPWGSNSLIWSGISSWWGQIISVKTYLSKLGTPFQYVWWCGIW